MAFPVGFARHDNQRIIVVLQHLMSMIKPEQFVIVGGLALAYYFARTNDQSEREFNDVDILIKRENLLLPTLSHNFFIYHHHHANEDVFYFALVDKETKVKIDIFDYSFSPQKVNTVEFDKQSIQIVSAEDQLVKTLHDCLTLSLTQYVDPKQLSDAKSLWHLINKTQAEEFWQRKLRGGLPETIEEAFVEAEELHSLYPQSLKTKPFRKDKPYQCKLCVNSEEFPITPMEKIYSILGYAE